MLGNGCDLERRADCGAPDPRSSWASATVRALAVLVALLLTATGLAAQQPGAAITGVVRDQRSGEAIEGVLVTVEGTALVALSDSAGRYRIGSVPPGPQVLRAERLGYAVTRLPLTVGTHGVIVRDLAMAVTALALKGITVTADVAGRARGELGTASVISTEAVREQPATSLAGLLELVPGVELRPPGLNGVQQIALRTAATSGSTTPSGQATVGQLASFGTLIVLDGVPESNNANMQSVPGAATGQLLFSSSAGGGVDLRRIPASTIQRVEVIRGVPSARYGDLTDGAIVVDTRAGVVTPQVRVHYDAQTGEASALAGEHVGPFGTATLTFDVADTRTKPGISNAHAYRLSTSLSDRLEGGTLVGPAGERRLTLDTRADFYQLIDDEPANPSQPGIIFNAHDSGLRLSERAQLRGRGDRLLEWTGALSIQQQHSFTQAPVLRAGLPFTDRLTPGLSTGFYITGQYTTSATVDGAPWMLYTRLEGSEHAEALGFEHQLRAGLELRREWNAGAGYQFDMRKPPQTDFNGVQGFERPRRFASIPAVATAAGYVDDRMSRVLPGGVGLDLQAGLRVDELARGQWWISRPQAVAVEPRLNIELLPRPWLRIRGAWGEMAKTPSLDELHPAPQYNDVVNVNWYTTDPAERLAVLTTFMEDPTNPDLGYALAREAELGVEVGVGRSDVSVVGFDNRTRGDVSLQPVPTHLVRAHYQLTDSIGGTGQPPSIVEPPSSYDTVPILLQRPGNNVTVDSRGIELTASLPELQPLHLRLQVEGSWVWTRRNSNVPYFGTTTQFSDFQLLPDRARTPYWSSAIETGNQALVTYRLVHHEPALGLVVTATVQQNIRDEQHDLGAADTLSFDGYLTRDGRMVPVPRDQRGLPQYADLRQPRISAGFLDVVAPADWLASLEVTKSLPLDGRLTFWAYNMFDRTGRIASGPHLLTRPYQPVRFGLDVSMPARALTGRVP